MKNQCEDYFKTREEFRELAMKCEAEIKADPQGYQERVRKFACIGYWYIAAVIAGCVFLLGAMLWLIFVVQFRVYTVIAIPLVILGSVLTGLLAKAPEQPGIRIQRSEAPRAFELLDSISGKVGAPEVDLLIIDFQGNASCIQRPERQWAGTFKSILQLGFPLVVGLSEADMMAVIAHEMGHFASRQGDLSVWLRQQQLVWIHMSRKCGPVLAPFLNWYLPRLDVRMIVLRRALEHQCDGAAATVVGPEEFGVALARTLVIGEFVNTLFFEKVNAQVAERLTPPCNICELFQETLDEGIPDQFVAATLKTRLAEEGELLTSDHPTLTERLLNIGWDTGNIDQHLTPNELTGLIDKPLSLLLHKEVQDLSLKVSKDWQESVATEWGKEHVKRSTISREIDFLRSGGGSEEDILFNEAKLLASSRGWDDAEPVLAKLLALNPGHAEANFAYGTMLVEKEDLGAEGYLLKAMEIEPRFRLRASQLLFNLFMAKRDETKALQYRRSMEAGRKELDVLQKAVHEIKSLDKLEAFHINDRLRREIAARVEGKKIDAVYAVRKVMKNSEGVSILLIRPKRPGVVWVASKDAQEMNSFTQLFSDLNEFDFIRVTRPEENWLKKKMSKIPGATIFPTEEERKAA